MGWLRGLSLGGAVGGGAELVGELVGELGGGSWLVGRVGAWDGWFDGLTDEVA